MDVEKVIKIAIKEVLSEDDDAYEWESMPDCCEACQDLNGERRAEYGEYPGGIKGPPLHEHCRCEEFEI